MTEINVGLIQWFINFFERKTAGCAIKSETMSNKELTEELRKPIIRKFEERKVRSSFIDNIWGADLADMQLISKNNKEFRFFSCTIDIYNIYAWVIPLKHKPNQLWVDIGSKFYNRSMKSWIEKNNIATYSTHNERKSVVAERFIRTLKYKIHRFMTSISKNIYINNFR